MPRTVQQSAQQTFWRDPALPFIEARHVPEGRGLHYGRHWHETHSIGVITGGRSTYVNGEHAEIVEAGAVVVINPGDVHGCNPVPDAPWSYVMFYIDPTWLGRVQASLRGTADAAFRPYDVPALRAPHVVDAGVQLFALLADAQRSVAEREAAVVDFVALLDGALAPGQQRAGAEKVERVADYIDAHFAQPLPLQDLCDAAQLSGSYLIRAFKKRYGVAPHEYQTNRRIQYAKARLRDGASLAEVALDVGFADQAHFQRVFKRMTAATPGQYRD
ncbi:AraC family transcriptional regulator [Massilia pinisoli]|uniref:AraC family transcriptional regulator n=1 Tax=Massilia pinisoli TaxID=1772194 RepID=A0ABT1ZTE9_9BURK|nr:AraC family transcriptional regulator [Massilia pinisoli]MCS0583203.1 AraC family transcriptional regulator [Massilia pinisoli]